MDHVALLALITGALTAAGVFLVRVFGEPDKRMAHLEALEALEAKAECAREKAHSRLVASWERRAADLEERLNRQDTRQALLESANAALRARVEVLEGQLKEAGILHNADLATIANLRQELDAQATEILHLRDEKAERTSRIAALEARVAELEAALRDDPPGAKAKAASKIKSAKKKGGRA